MKLLNKLAYAAAFMVGASGVQAQDHNLKTATIAPGTSAYLAMTTMATLVNQNLDSVNIQVDTTGAATKHMIEVAQGKLDMIYDITKIYWEASKEAMQTNPWLKDVTLEYAVQDGGMSLHPGALRLYEEIGLDIPDGSR